MSFLYFSAKLKILMRKTVLQLFVMASMILWVACSGKTEKTEEAAAEEQAATDNDAWPEMDEFHMLMAESFHPFKDSANLDPAIANAGDLAAMAEKWANAPLPERVNNDEVKGYLNELKTSTAAFTQLTASGDSTKIGASLTQLHDQFHKLQEAWYGKGDGHKHEH